MAFKPSTCYVLCVCRTKCCFIHPYTMLGHTLQAVDHYYPYLGVSLSENLNWKPHILNITNKANSTLGFVKRNLHHCPQKVKDQAYKRSTLEYGCTASGIRIEHTRNHGSNRSSTGSTHRNKNLHEGGGMRNQRPKATILANSRKKKTSS